MTSGANRTPEPVGPAADQVRRKILDLVRRGELQPGARLGSERDLAVEFGVSRSTLRQALAALEAAGAVHRVPGRGGGTFVGNGKVERDLSKVVGVPQLLRSLGIVAGTQVISTGVVAADDATAAALEIAPGGFVFDVVRVRLADRSPISLEHARLPADRFPGLLDLPLGGSVYELLETHFDARPDEALERIEVVDASADEGQMLGLPEGAPLLLITRVTRDGSGVPIEYSHDLFRADRTRIVVRTPRSAAASDSDSVRTHGRRVELHIRSPA